jgi:tetratricopeptide (TPR) repeat protein
MTVKDLYKEGQKFLVEGKEEESIDSFTKALESGAEPYMTYLSRGVAYMNLGKAEAALEDFTRAIDIKTTNDRPYYYRGVTYMVREDYRYAIDDFTRALEFKIDHFQARLARGICFARLGKFEEASADIRAVIPEMEANVQKFVDEHGIVRTEMWKVMNQLTGERKTPEVDLTDGEIQILREWASRE